MPARPPKRRGPRVDILRVGHRPGRDPRLTTHLALTARALGAGIMWIHPPARDLAERMTSLNERWGGQFRVVDAPDWRSVIRAHPGETVHLTMYGQPLDRVLPRLRRASRLLLVVGGAKVPPDLYGLARWNVAVGAQPHSEVAAVAILLDRLGRIPPPRRFRGGTHRIRPSARGKSVVRVGGAPS